MMGLISEGISGVRAFEPAAGVAASGETFGEPWAALVCWRSAWRDKLHQVYVNGEFAGATLDCGQRRMVVPAPRSAGTAARVEVFAVEPGEADADFGEELTRPGEKSRVGIAILRRQELPFEGTIEIYRDGGTGVIDYGTPLTREAIRIWPQRQDKAGFGMSRFGEGDFGYDWAAAVGFGRGSFGHGEFGADGDIIEWTSPELEAGVYRFGIVVVDGYGNRSQPSETGDIIVIPAARPAEELSALSFDGATNAVVLGVEG